MNLGDIRTLQTEAEYQSALAAVRPYFEHEPEAGTPQAAHFDALVLLIEEYEERYFPIERAEPLDIIKSIMEANGYTRADLVAVIGSKARAADLLNGRREINLDQIRKLSKAWGIPPAALISDRAA